MSCLSAILVIYLCDRIEREREKKKKEKTRGRSFPVRSPLLQIIYRGLFIALYASSTLLSLFSSTFKIYHYLKNNNKSIRLNSVSSIDLPRRDTRNRGFWVKWRTVSKILNDFKIIY